MRRKLSAFVIMVLLMMHLFALSAYAETAQQDGLVVTLQTNRDVYDSNEQIQVSIEIKNTNETAVQNVKVMPYASEPYMLANANQSTINIGTMKDQSIEKVDIVFIRGEDIAITLPMTGDSSHPLFWGSCLVISLGIVCVLLKQKKGLRFLSLFLCLCICSSVISVHHAEASDAEAQMIVVEKTIDVAGESVTVGVGVSYNHVGNASQTGTLTASQTTILANSSASPVYFYVQADGEFTSVSLIDALTGLNVATMLDDGQYSISGDDLPNDDIYSCVVYVPSASVGTQRYYARMTDASNHTVLTNEVEISVVGKFTGTDLEAMDQVHDSLGMLVSSLEYQRMSIGERAEAIAEQLQVHAENGLIDGSSIKYDTRNQIYTFTHANGVLGGVMLAPFHSDLNGSAPMTRAERETAALAKQQQKQMRSFALMRMMPANAYEDMEIGDAMIFYAFDEAVNSSRYPHYLSMANDWSARGLNTSIDQAVTVEELKSIDDYKVAVLSMHGVCYQSRDKSGAVLCLQEEATESKNKLYTSDLKKRNLATVTLDNGKTCYWVFASFFEDHYGANDLQNTFIFSEACSFWGENSTSDKSMALAFEKAGATAVVGFYNPVYTEYSRDMLQHYVDSLLDGKTAYEALMAGQKKYGSDDSKYTGSTSNSLFSFVKGAAYALFGGSTDSQLIASDLKNTSFEQASSASGWNTAGDVRVLTKLASLKPTNGSRMAILTTGIGSAESSYLEGTEGSILSQSFIVPSEAGAVQFQYDVVSEEPMEYVDSIFDDKFVVRILGSNGQVYKEKTIESVNESTWYSISGIDFEGGDDTTYHTQWKTGVIDISEYRNQAITLQFVVYDMGDSIYDTAALIDDVKLLSGSGFEIDECSLHLSTSSWTPILTGESKTVSVTKHDGSSFSVKVTQLDPNGNALDSANEWLTVSKSGSSIKLTATANYAAQPRTATVTVTCACGGTKKLIVTQMSGAPKPTSKVTLQSADATYTITGINNDYTDRFVLNNAGADTLYVKVDGTHVGRIFATLKQVGGEGHALSSQSKEFSPTQSSASATLSFVIPKDTPAGTYRCTVYVSNSAIPNAAYKQNADTIEFDIKINSTKIPPLVIQQNSKEYKDIPYGSKGLGYNGCGLVSVVNAYMYKSGNTEIAYQLISVMAAECEKTKQYTFNSLSTTISTVFSNFINISTKAYGAGTYKISTVTNHIANGGIAIIGSANSNYYQTTNSGNHFVALVDFRKNGNTTEFLMLDSAIENKIGTPLYTNVSGYGWVSESVVASWEGGVNLVTFSDYNINLNTDLQLGLHNILSIASNANLTLVGSLNGKVDQGMYDAAYKTCHDFKAPEGTAIYAPMDGSIVCTQVAYNKNGTTPTLISYGNRIVFTSADGKYIIVFGHLSSFAGVSTTNDWITESEQLRSSEVSKNLMCNRIKRTAEVQKGEIIGYAGNTGHSYGAHLHVEVYSVENNRKRKLFPCAFFKKELVVYQDEMPDPNY